jgi:SET domain-containing protein
VSFKSVPAVKKRNENNSEIDYPRLHILSSTIQCNLANVYLKESEVHGQGCFANRDIKCGELITFYPGDIIEITPNKDRDVDDHKTGVYPSERLYRKYGNITDKKHQNNDYAFVIDDMYMIFGEPSFNEDPNYMGHFINDKVQSDSTKESDKIYEKISQEYANCQIHSIENLHVCVLACKDIKKDEELFTSYGIGYWKSHNKNKILLV